MSFIYRWHASKFASESHYFGNVATLSFVQKVRLKPCYFHVQIPVILAKVGQKIKKVPQLITDSGPCRLIIHSKALASMLCHAANVMQFKLLTLARIVAGDAPSTERMAAAPYTNKV